MSSDLAAAWIGAFATVGSAVAAGMAWRAAKKSSDASKELTALEASRRHDELTPILTAKVESLNPGNSQHYRLTLGLDGPVALIRLSSMIVRVRDDRPGRDQETIFGREATPEAVRTHVWGPLRFSPMIGPEWAKSDETGRCAAVTRALDVGEGVPFQLERTLPPIWYRHEGSNDESWRQDAGAVLRLSVTAHAEGSGPPWILPIEVDLAAANVEGFSSRGV